MVSEAVDDYSGENLGKMYRWYSGVRVPAKPLNNAPLGHHFGFVDLPTMFSRDIHVAIANVQSFLGP